MKENQKIELMSDNNMNTKCKNNIYPVFYHASVILLGASLTSLLLLLPPVQNLIIRLYEFVFSKAGLMDRHHQHIVATKGIYAFSMLLMCSLACYGISRLKEYGAFEQNQKIHFWTSVTFFFILYAVHQFFYPSGDDTAVSAVWDTSLLSQFILDVMRLWQTRILGLFTPVLVRLPLDIWRFLDSVCMTAVAEGIVRLSLKKENRAHAFLIYLMVLLVPLSVYNSSGWVMTTTTYVWPLACSMPGFVIIKRDLTHEESTPYEYAVSFVLSAIGVTELSLVPVFFFASLIFLVYQGGVEKRRPSMPSAYIIAVFVLSVLGLFFALLAPGNRSRSVSELHWFPGYDMLDFTDKMRLGMLAVMPCFWGLGYGLNYIIFPLLFVMSLKFARDRQWKLATAQIPGIAIAVFFGVFPVVLGKVTHVPSFLLLFKNVQLDQFLQSPSSNFSVSLELNIYLYVLLVTVISVFYAAGKGYRGIIAVLIFVAGFCTRFMLGFSPTVYVSGIRTAYYMAISVFIVTAIIWDSWAYNDGSVNFEKELRYVFIFAMAVFLIDAVAKLPNAS